MSESEAQRLSTSALANRLKLPMQQLFVTLRDYGWIERCDKSWRLTGKGELHGGSYQDSKRYGRYIVWPESLIEHPLLKAIESNQRITPAGMRRYYPHLGVAQINRQLAELGLLRFSKRGLTLTDLGEHFGGRQEQDEDNALLVVSWPHELVDNPVIHRELSGLGRNGQLSGGAPEQGPVTKAEPETSDPIAPDLFSTADADSASQQAATAHAHCGLDGHPVESVLQLRVCDWLYQAQLAHARNRLLPVKEELRADFYVPAFCLYIECWERDVPTDALTRRLRTREVCRELGLAYQEVAAGDVERIDEILTARLRELEAGE